MSRNLHSQTKVTRLSKKYGETENSEYSNGSTSKNLFYDSNDGCNLNYYKPILNKRFSNNDSMQWMIHLRNNANLSQNSDMNYVPTCYEPSINQRHSVSDVSYKGNANDIRHLLKDKINGYRIIQHEISLRDINSEYRRRKKIKEFDLTPFKIAKDYSTFLPADKNSITKHKTILVKMKEDLKDKGEYGLKIKEKNSNNFRHLVTGQQNTETLKWELSLRE